MVVFHSKFGWYRTCKSRDKPINVFSRDLEVATWLIGCDLEVVT